MTFCDVLKISRNLYSAKMLLAPTSCCSRFRFRRGLTPLSIVFSECQAAVGMRFLGRQLSAKTSLLLVTGPEQGEHGSFGRNNTSGKGNRHVYRFMR